MSVLDLGLDTVVESRIVYTVSFSYMSGVVPMRISFSSDYQCDIIQRGIFYESF